MTMEEIKEFPSPLSGIFFIPLLIWKTVPMKHLSCFRPLFRGCFLFNAVVKSGIIGGQKFPSPLSGMFFIPEQQGLHVRVGICSFRPLFRGCFLLTMNELIDGVAYVAQFPSPLSRMFFISHS